MERNGRRQTVDELLRELDTIVNHTPPDDKTPKRRIRLEFLIFISQSATLSFFYQTIAYYLNGGPIEWSDVNEAYGSLFGLGSQPTSNIDDYPAVDEVLAFMDGRRQRLLQVLEACGDEQLAVQTPEGAPEFMPDFASVFKTAIWHEGLHSGQLSLIRRSLGFEPLV